MTEDRGDEAAADATDPTFEEVAPRLGAILSGALYLGGELAPVVRVALLPRLYLHAVVEGDPARLVLATEAGRWQRSHAEIVAAALDRTVDRDISLEQLEESGIHRLGPYEESSVWVLVPGFLRAIAKELGGPVVCAVPSGSTCLIARADDPVVVERLYELALQIFESSERPVSPVLYAEDPETAQIGALVVDRSNPSVFDAAARAERLLERHAYQEQKAALLEALAGQGLDVLVGDLQVAHLRSGWATTTIFVAVAGALLPVAEHLFLGFTGPAGPRRVLIRLEDFLRLAPGCLLVVPDHDPPRMTPMRVPSSDELEAIWEAAVVKDEGVLPDEPPDADEPPEPGQEP